MSVLRLKSLKVITSKLFKEVKIFEPSVFNDLRGNIYTSFQKDWYAPYLNDLNFKHDKFAFSRNNVLRGLHGDHKTWKMVSCVCGEIIEVLVDMREDSPTFKKWEMFELSGKNYRQILIPPGFVNGYYVLSDHAVFHYKLAYPGDYIDANEQITVKWNDPDINIPWPFKNPILQDRDK